MPLTVLTKTTQKLTNRGDGLLAESGFFVFVSRAAEESGVSAGTILVGVAKALVEELQRFGHLGMRRYGAIRSSLPSSSRTAFRVEKREHQVICVLVFVTVLESKDLKHGVREYVCHAYGDA